MPQLVKQADGVDQGPRLGIRNLIAEHGVNQVGDQVLAAAGGGQESGKWDEPFCEGLRLQIREEAGFAIVLGAIALGIGRSGGAAAPAKLRAIAAGAGRTSGFGAGNRVVNDFAGGFVDWIGLSVCKIWRLVLIQVSLGRRPG